MCVSTLKSSIRQALNNRGFYMGIVGVIAIIILSSLQDILAAFRAEELMEYGFFETMILNALVSEGMILALPILAALPFTASFVDDIKSGYIKFNLHRTSRQKYIVGKCIACAVSGGLTLVFGILAAYVISALVFLPMEAPLPKGAESAGYFAEIMGKVLLFFFSGAFWSVVGLTAATLTNSKYMAYASPFVIYYVLIILYERYFDRLYILYPKEWTAPSSSWMWGNIGVVLLVSELIIIMGVVFGSVAKRRLAQV